MRFLAHSSTSVTFCFPSQRCFTYIVSSLVQVQVQVDSMCFQTMSLIFIKSELQERAATSADQDSRRWENEAIASAVERISNGGLDRLET